MPDPYSVVEALRESGFPDRESIHDWLMTPNDDLDGRKPAALMSSGQYEDIIRAAQLRRARLNRPTYKTIDDN